MNTYTNYIVKHAALCAKLNAILPNFEKNITRVVDVMLLTIDPDVVDKFLEKVNDSFAHTLKTIIVSQNRLLNAETHPIGVEISNFFNSGSAQNILNVKHLTGKVIPNEAMTPVINTTTLHRKTKNLTWFRLRVTSHTDLQNELKTMRMTYNILSPNIAEVVYETTELKTSSLITEYREFLKYYDIFNESSHVNEIIFFSNCMDLAQLSSDKNLIYSNIFKFYYCAHNNKLDTTFLIDDIEYIWNLQIHAALLQLNLNFNTNKSKIINPLGLLSSEKNSAALLAACENWYATGTPRESLLLGKGSEIGGISKQDIRIKLNID